MPESLNGRLAQDCGRLRTARIEVDVERRREGSKVLVRGLDIDNSILPLDKTGTDPVVAATVL